MYTAPSATRSGEYLLDGLRGVDNEDALVPTAQAAKMLVTGYDQIGTPRERTGEHVVIVGVVLDDARHFHRRGHKGEAPHPAVDAADQPAR